jgi:dihydropyrimidinase
VADGYTSFKVFMTYENLRLNDREILDTMDVARETGALVMVHCENEDAIAFLISKHVAQGELAPKFHASSRPAIAEREATHRAIALAEVVEVPVVIVHVSNRAAMEEISRGKARGRLIAGETCPQYLVLTADDLDGMDWEGAKFVCSPPPRDTESQQACWEGLQDGTFTLFSSDHCPFRYDDVEGKLNPRGQTDFRWIPNGIPGVETRLPILFSEGVTKGRISLQQFVALGSTNHAKTYGLYPQKGEIAVGSDADIVIWDPELDRPITQSALHHGADYTPYEGLMIKGWPTTTILRGEVVVESGEPISAKPAGRYVSRTKSMLVQTAKV